LNLSLPRSPTLRRKLVAVEGRFLTDGPEFLRTYGTQRAPQHRQSLREGNNSSVVFQLWIEDATGWCKEFKGLPIVNLRVTKVAFSTRFSTELLKKN
jgi:hypothetical protein